jgi:ABC-type multidrug transport system ATPase subunit
MQISLQHIGKSYNEDWIFRKLDYQFLSNTAYAVLGANGSGKSTLLKLIAGHLLPSEGSIIYTGQDGIIASENIFRSVSIAAPYLELIEEFTLSEVIVFHQRFKTFRNQLNQEEVLAHMDLEGAQNKILKHFSSGMKQRVKLALAILSSSEILLLDEPTSNLDKKGIEWYKALMAVHSDQRITLVCSNQQQQEYAFCAEFLNIEAYKLS